MKRRHLLATAALGLGLVTGGAAMAQDKTKACWVYVGPIGDLGWSYQHHQGLLAVEAAYGDKVETAYQESVPLALGWVVASHLLLTLSAGVFKLSVVVVMACRHGRRHAM